ncbi:C-type mannose receptor 2-like [Alosa sapidissima]|uniref:C-type mannose receptor 2-like n=1 Tax=Alosa sapidissima TaxID=34773 RepID=UPI001C089681|nr:C-type mannose receptor 2-like [Alosa sapidissima]
MTPVIFILLLSVCVMSSASGYAIPEIIVGLQPDNSTDALSVHELIVQSETRTEDSSALRGSCPKDWELYGQRCFRFISTARTWAEAERFCLLLGGHLASVHSVAEYHFIQGLIVTQTHDSTPSWIGGSDAQQNGIWFWSDGSRFTFTLWNPSEPNNVNGAEHCLHMNWGGGLGWNDIPCSQIHPSVCARSYVNCKLIVQSKNTTDDSPAIQVYSGTCPVGWELYNQHCFRFISSLKTWAEAERFCLLLGGHLASVHSVAEYHFIQVLIVTQTLDSPYTWIGGSDAQQEGFWFWSDGSRFAFTYWNSPIQPDNAGGAEHCLHINAGGGLLWNDYPCSNALPSVCARS